MTTGRIIIGDACVQEGADWLAGQDARLATALAQTGPLPLRLRPDGFEQLQNAIISQQVSVASANAISARMKEAGLTDPARVLLASDDDLRAVGLSRQKMRYVRALAEADIDYTALRAEPSEVVIKRLTQVSGIGVWTAEIYAMFSLGRADVFAPGDLALQEAARILYDLPDRPKDRALREMSLRWSPWRSVAARILWAYYRVATRHKGLSD